MRKVLVIINKSSGRAKLRCREKMISKKLQALNIDHQIIPFPKTGEKIDFQMIEKSYHFDSILIAGGDGTIRTVLEQMYFADIKKEITVYPMGSANVFCRMHAIPADLGYLQSPARKETGFCLFNKKHVFFIGAVFGQAAKMTIDAHCLGKHIIGPLSYVVAAFASLFFLPRKKVIVRGNPLLCHSVLVFSPDFVQKIFPKVFWGGNRLIAIFMQEKGFFEVIETLRKIFSQKIIPHKTIIKQQENVEFTGDFSGTMHIDGDPILPSSKRFTIEFKKNIFTLLVPKKTSPF